MIPLLTIKVGNIMKNIRAVQLPIDIQRHVNNETKMYNTKYIFIHKFIHITISLYIQRFRYRELNVVGLMSG